MDLGDVYELSKRLGKMGFADLVRRSSGHTVIRYDGKDAEHRTLARRLTKALNNFVKHSRKATRFTGNRINDIGSALEDTITQEMRKMDLESEKLSKPGYPDLLVRAGGVRAYIEIKSSGTKKKGRVNHRLFYYTSGKKVELDAIHLLLQIELSEVKDKLWIVDGWTLRDLHMLKVSLKSEFNANQKDFEALGAIAASGNDAAQTELM